MKKICVTFILIIFMFIFTGCGQIDESWNGIYTNGSDYSILIYTEDNNIASIAVKQAGENFTFYPVNYAQYLKVNETNLTALRGEALRITKNGNQIKVSIDSEEKGVWKKIEGDYTKTKNARAFNFNQF